MPRRSLSVRFASILPALRPSSRDKGVAMPTPTNPAAPLATVVQPLPGVVSVDAPLTADHDSTPLTEPVLPYDVLVRVVRHVAAARQGATLAALARCNKDLEELALPLLYADVGRTRGEAARLVAALVVSATQGRYIAAAVERGARVRRIEFDLPPRHGVRLFSAQNPPKLLFSGVETMVIKPLVVIRGESDQLSAIPVKNLCIYYPNNLDAFQSWHNTFVGRVHEIFTNRSQTVIRGAVKPLLDSTITIHRHTGARIPVHQHASFVVAFGKQHVGAGLVAPTLPLLIQARAAQIVSHVLACTKDHPLSPSRTFTYIDPLARKWGAASAGAGVGVAGKATPRLTDRSGMGELRSLVHHMLGAKADMVRLVGLEDKKAVSMCVACGVPAQIGPMSKRRERLHRQHVKTVRQREARRAAARLEAQKAKDEAEVEIEA